MPEGKCRQPAAKALRALIEGAGHRLIAVLGPGKSLRSAGCPTGRFRQPLPVTGAVLCVPALEIRLVLEGQQ
ncbi:hypothetical protein CP973_23210 [Streptomyces albofaciens JCM 4342]|nr:hypothetical protein CP973_23210 [Streptomyces albofaciens JCM 4342]